MNINKLKILIRKLIAEAYTKLSNEEKSTNIKDVDNDPNINEINNFFMSEYKTPFIIAAIKNLEQKNLNLQQFLMFLRTKEEETSKLFQKVENLEIAKEQLLIQEQYLKEQRDKLEKQEAIFKRLYTTKEELSEDLNNIRSDIKYIEENKTTQKIENYNELGFEKTQPGK